jgi:von Willebrand factor A domain-containing protein 7
MRPIICVLITVIAAASRAESQSVRFGPGVCGPIDPVYVKGATETGGQPFPVSAAEVGKSSRVMEASFLPEMILWASGDRENSYSISVDPTVARVMFSGTFDTTGGSLTLVAPDGTVMPQGERIEDTPLNCGRITTVEAPASGTWQVRMVPTGRFWLRVHAKSELSMTDAEFVEPGVGTESDRLVKIQGQPIASRPATLRVYVSTGIKSPKFQLVSLDARPLLALDLQSTDNREFSGSLTLPTEPFRVLVTGRDESDTQVQRIWPFLFHGEDVEVIPPAGETVIAGAEMPVTFTIRNHGPAVRLSLVSSDHSGKVVAVEPPALELAAGAEGIATVRLTVPADAPPKSKASIRLTATSEGAAAVGFNSASKTVTVIRD